MLLVRSPQCSRRPPLMMPATPGDCDERKPMSMSSLLKAFLTALGIVLGSAALSAESESPLACAPQAFEEVSYIVCGIDLRLARPRLFWKGADGQPYRTFAN